MHYCTLRIFKILKNIVTKNIYKFKNLKTIYKDMKNY